MFEHKRNHQSERKTRFRASGPWNMLLCIVLLTVMSCSEKPVPKEEATQTEQIRLSGVFSDQYDDTLVRDLSSDPQYLNPVLTNDYTSSLVENLIFNSMTDIDGTPDSNIVGRLAERWKISEDKLQITFFLRKGVTWHDGEPFTAQDVKFTFDTAMRSDIPAFGKKSTVETIKLIEILDPHTVRFTFKYRFSPALSNVGGMFIIPKHRLDEKGLAAETERLDSEVPITFVTSEFSRSPIGTGPYKFVEWKTAQHIKLEKYDNYWDTQHVPTIQKVFFKIIPNRTVAFNILQKGDLDVLRTRPIQYLRFERSDDIKQNYQAKAFFMPNYFYIGWNNSSERKFFKNRQVRRAMSHAFDRQAFIEKVLYGLGKQISGPFYIKSWAYNQDIKPLAYDVDKAVEILTQEGWLDRDRDGVLDLDGVKFDFELLLPSGSPSFAQLASIIQANMKKLSIVVSINQYEWSVYLGRVRKGEFDAYLGGWNLSSEPDPYGIWHSSQIGIGNNYIAFRNEEVDTLLEQGRREFDRDKRKDIYARIHEIINQEQPYTFIHSSKETFIISKRVKNFTISPFGLYDFYPGQLDWRLE